MHGFKRVLRPLSFGLSGALLVWTASLLVPDRYTSKAVIRVNAEPFPDVDIINDAYQDIVSRTFLAALIERLNLYPAERDRLPMADVIDAARKDDIKLDIQPNLDVWLSFAYRDPGLAQNVVETFMSQMVASSSQHLRMEPDWGRIEIRQSAGPARPVSTLAFWRPARYVSRGILRVKRQGTVIPERATADRQAEYLRRTAISNETLTVLVRSQHLNAFGNTEDPSGFLDSVRHNSRADRRGNILTISFTYPDAERAQKTGSVWTTLLADAQSLLPVCAAPSSAMGFTDLESSSVQPDPPGAHSPSSSADESALCLDPHAPEWQRKIYVLDPANVPEKPDGPSRPILVIFGFFLGLGLSVALSPSRH